MRWRARRKRGLKPGRCTLAAGPLGVWAAVGEPYPTRAEHRCWNPRLPTGLEALPKQPQAEARPLLGALPAAAPPAACEALRADCTNR